MNVIFGSGVVGLLARHILGPTWTVVPFYRSRFFTFNPALDDNFIISSPELDPVIKELTPSVGQPQTFPYRRVWSLNGTLIKEYDSVLCNEWLHKIFGSNVPPQAEIYMSGRMSLQVYDIRVNGLYQQLMAEYLPEIKEQSIKGLPTEIGHHYMVRNGVREDFENAVSTIPLDALCRLMKIDFKPKAKTLHYMHIETEKLDFEGANQLLVVDKIFDFFKATNIAKGRYLIYMHNDVPDPGVYLMNFIEKFEIIDGTAIDGVIPLGHAPKLQNLEDAGIFCVGSSAQWDWCMDVGSCILRLLRYAGRGNKPATPKIIQL
jgi:hypothetical protein